MPQPSISYRRLVSNSLSAMLAAIEIYNKPRMEYRDEVTVLLVVNAWELALKAALKKERKRIFYPKKRGEPYRTLAAEDALKQVVINRLFPSEIDGTALEANVRALIAYRNRATHLYVTDLGEMVYPFLQTSVLNFRDYMLYNFKKDIADSISWQLLPLGAKAPSEPVQFMKAELSKNSPKEVRDFIDGLRTIVDKAEAAGADMQRVAAVYDVHLQSTKSVTSADLVVSVHSEGEHVVIKKTDPNLSHPFTATELLQRVNRKHKGRKLTTYDREVICWKENLRENPRMAWKHKKGVSCTWSNEAVKFMAELSDEDYDRARKEYRVYRNGLRNES